MSSLARLITLSTISALMMASEQEREFRGILSAPLVFRLGADSVEKFVGGKESSFVAFILARNSVALASLEGKGGN